MEGPRPIGCEAFLPSKRGEKENKVEDEVMARYALARARLSEAMQTKKCSDAGEVQALFKEHATQLAIRDISTLHALQSANASSCEEPMGPQEVA